MKVRIKFAKTGPMKFIGHLDTMRYFQKAIRRAKLPAAFTAGFSPHMKMSFAAPLGVGMTSEGEYFDLELSREMNLDMLAEALDGEMAEGFRVLGAVPAPEGKAGNAMSQVAAADYLVWFREGKEPAEDWQNQLPDFLAQPEVRIRKIGKSGEREVDIRPFIYEAEYWEEECRDSQARPHALFLRLASASANYTRPDQVMEAFCAFLGVPLAPYALLIHRLETYGDVGKEGTPVFRTLSELGGV